jgi:hypothetical protein
MSTSTPYVVKRPRRGTHETDHPVLVVGTGLPI